MARKPPEGGGRGGMEHLLSQLSEEANSAEALSSDFQPPETGDDAFLLLKPPSLW